MPSNEFTNCLRLCTLQIESLKVSVSTPLEKIKKQDDEDEEENKDEVPVIPVTVRENPTHSIVINNRRQQHCVIPQTPVSTNPHKQDESDKILKKLADDRSREEKERFLKWQAAVGAKVVGTCRWKECKKQVTFVSDSEYYYELKCSAGCRFFYHKSWYFPFFFFSVVFVSSSHLDTFFFCFFFFK